ncbi:MAG: hypothetical protein JO256_06500 [Alphaproteobacteria bacterium]|nr:hypothetical protein [Alphaproteobacteria bacterium]
MNQEELEQLVVSMSADYKSFQKDLQKVNATFREEAAKLESRHAELNRKLSGSIVDFSKRFVGLDKVGAAIAGLTAAGITVGLGDLVKKSLEAAVAIGDTAVQAGVSVERLQELRFAAGQSGASMQVLDEGLTTLNKNLGEFVNTHGGKAAAAFKNLGIDKLITNGTVRDAEGAFDAIVGKLKGVQSEAQKAAYMANFFGKEAGPQLLQLVNQGADGISRLEQQAKSLGIVLSAETVEGARKANDRLTALFDVIKAEGIAAVAGLAPEIANLAKQITDGLPGLIQWVEKWSAWFGLIDLTPGQKLNLQLAEARKSLAALQEQKKTFGNNPILSLFSMVGAGGTDASELDTYIANEQKKIADLEGQIARLPREIETITVYGSKPALHINDPGAATRGIEEVRSTPAVQIKEDEFQKQSAAAQKNIAALKAEGEAFGMTAGQAEAYRWKQEALLAIHVAGKDATEDQVKVLNVLAAAMANAADANEHLKDTEEAYRQQLLETRQRQEEFKNDLVDVLAQGVHGFGSLKNAAGQFLGYLGEMIVKTMILKPLVESLFGDGISLVSSTPSVFSGGGSFFGRIFGDIGKAIGIPGFAGGTDYAPGGLAWVGEHGPELLNLPRGSQVIPMSAMRGGGALTLKSEFTIHVTGNGDKELLQRMRAGVSDALSAYDKSLPSKVAYLTANPLVR